MTENRPNPVRPQFPQELALVMAEDAETLAILHDRELTPVFLRFLKELGFPDSLGMLPCNDAVRQAWDEMAQAVCALPDEPTAGDMDELAADYTAIYLNSTYNASPCESAWVSDEHLVCQESMFQLRRIYDAAGLKTANWRCRPDDHLVLQLLYIAHSLRQADAEEAWIELARVMDEHLLRWLPGFAHRVASRCRQRFYGALALLTACWCDQLRETIALLLDRPRPSPEEVEERLNVVRSVPENVLVYMPEMKKNGVREGGGCE